MEHTKHPVRRCAVYTRKSSEEGSSRTSIRSRRNAKPVRRSFAARRARAGG